MGTIFDTFEHPAGGRPEETVERAARAFRGRHGCEPVAVWLHPAIAPDGGAVAGLPVKVSQRMSSWYVYLELPAPAVEPVQLALGGTAWQDELAAVEELRAGPATWQDGLAREDELLVGPGPATAAPRKAGGPVQLGLF